MIALTGIPVIRTARLVLRGPKTSDFDIWAACAASARAQFIGGPIDRGLAWRAFCHLTGHWLHRGYSMFIFADPATDAPLGMAGPWFPEGWPEPEIGWTVWDPAAEGRGYAFEAATAARAWAYETLGWTTAISLIAEGNQRSAALARRMGAQLEATRADAQHGQVQTWRHPGSGDLPQASATPKDRP